ncbi:MAG TPA: tetratricopeptide repeat protein [Candidatus Ozemobacteraceae bacterium]|nr:tetratricopeptide repeat protein [Candidatus Ozemobacteraceae bacterium]
MPAEELFPRSPLITFIGILISFLCVQMLLQTTFLSTLPRTMAFTTGTMLIMTMLVTLSSRIGSRILRHFGYLLPGVWLWFFPFLSLLFSHAFFFVLIKPIPDLLGRDCWTRILGLNAKCTTLAISSAFSGTMFFLALYLIIGAFRFLERTMAAASELEDQLLAEVSRTSARSPGSPPAPDTAALAPAETLPTVKEQLQAMEAGRHRARSFNRVAILVLFVCLAVMASWVVFARPETILYYRGMMQLFSRQHPEHALAAFQHLAQKYPTYTYLDTVLFQAAWTLDRRLGRTPEAMQAYREFLDRFGVNNVWADDVTANLVRLALDKQANATETLHWTNLYQQQFPEGPFSPHILLYEMRALLQLGRTDEARQKQQQALSRFGESSIPLYNSEDDFMSLLPFRMVLESLIEPATTSEPTSR